MTWPAERAAQWVRGAQSTFSEDDYKSGDGMQTAIFGPIFWTAIHLVSFNFPVDPTPEQRARYKAWLLATGNVLPCRHCRENFTENIRSALKGRALDDVFESRDSFSRFCYELHEKVNEMLNKSANPTFEDIRSMYEGFRSRCLTPLEEASLLKTQTEKGCVQEKHAGTKGKCILHIVPRDTECEALSVSSECKVRRIEPMALR